MSKAYFLFGEKYVRYDVESDATDAGYPRPIGDGWTGTTGVGFASDLDAALDLGQGKTFFFKGAQYCRLDSITNNVDAGYPMAIGDNWKGLADAGMADGLDAAVNWGTGAAYFFKADQYVTYDITADQVTAGRAPIADGWPGLASAGFGDNIDAVVVWGNGKAYFFKGDQYLRWDVASSTVDDGYPMATADGWSSLAQAGFASGLSAAYVKVSPNGPPGGGGQSGSADDLTDGFFTGLKELCDRLACQPEDMLAVMMSESGVKPGAQNPNGKATGLIQFMPATLKGLGWTDGPDSFAQLSADDQLPYVEKYFRPYVQHGLGSAGRLYQATFLPGTMPQGSNESTIVCAANGPHADAYAANKGLDMDGDGTITVGDLTARTDKMRHGGRWDGLMARLAAA